MCADWVVVNGERVRRRSPAERETYQKRGGKCPLLCEAGECALEGPVDPEAEATIRSWRLCGGSKRFCWPSGGGVSGEDATTVFAFEALDQSGE